jgi:selenide,water dikinase
MQSVTPVIKDLVLIGGGHSHVSVLKSFGMQPLPGVRLTLISRDTHTPYSGMLPGLIAGHYTIDEAHIDLAPLTRFAGARFLRSSVIGIDTAARTVLLADRPPVPYDVLSINSGSTPSTEGIQGADEFVVPVKPISRFLAHWQKLRERVAARTSPTTITVIGGGAGSVELILAIQHTLLRSPQQNTSDLDVTFALLTANDEILSTHPISVARRFRRILADRGVQICTRARVTEVREGIAVDDNGREFASDEFLWVTHAGAPSWLAEAGLEVDEQGFLLIDDQLRSCSEPNIFGAGDVATMKNHQRPKAGVFAVRQGRPLTNNLRQCLLGHRPRRYRPQKQFLTLISSGDQYAVASRGGWSAEGAWVWRWKDWIDRRFMLRYQELPEMGERQEQPVPAELLSPELKELTDDPMRCGGCGAKVGADVLSEALQGLQPLPRDDVIAGLNQPDDAALVAVPEGKLSVLSIDAFRPMILDPFLFGQITANHCLGDIYAMGAEPQSALTIATLPVWPQDKLVDELRQMLLGALEVFRASNTALVGGHTSEGVELSLGFSITGLIDADQVLHKATLQAGDTLVQTKAVGTGTIMAADMRARAQGRWVDDAITSMLHSNQEAGRVLRAHDASACTDITGFGLVGHILEMLAGSGLGATLNLDQLPVLQGAIESIAAGIVSSLQPKNERFVRRLEIAETVQSDPRLPLLYDPQTAGGLLAGVPRERVDACIADLREQGYAATAIVGEVHPVENSARPVRVVSS